MAPSLLALHWIYPETRVLGDSVATVRSVLAEVVMKTPRGWAAEVTVGGRRTAIRAFPLDRPHRHSPFDPRRTTPRTLRILPLDDGPATEEDVRLALEKTSASSRVADLAVIPIFFPRDPKTPETCGADPFAVLPSAPPAPPARARLRKLVRRLAPTRFGRWSVIENLRALGVDPADDVEKRRFTHPPSAAEPERRAAVVAFEGSDGAGKSTHVRALVESLAADGLIALPKKMYRHGVFHATVTAFLSGCRGGENLDLWRLERAAKIRDSLKYFVTDVADDLQRADVLVFDRYVQTHLAAAVGRAHWDAWGAEMLEIYPRADLVFWLDLPASRAIDRLESRDQRTMDEHPYMIERYRHAFLGMSEREGFVRLDATRPFAENREVVRQLTFEALRARRAKS